MKTIFEIMADLAEDASNIPVLRHILVKNGAAVASDMDTSIAIKAPSGLDDGLYYHQSWKHLSPIKNNRLCMDDFPVAKTPDKEKIPESGGIWATVTVPVADLGHLKWVTCAASTEEKPYYLNGACFNISDREIVATDAHRLHMLRDIETEFLPQHLPENTGAIIRRQDMDIVIGAAESYALITDCGSDDAPQKIEFSFFAKKWVAEILAVDGSVICLVTGKQIDATYPLYKNLHPKDGEWKGEFPYHANPVKEACRDIEIRAICNFGNFRNPDTELRFRDGVAETPARETHPLYSRYDLATAEFPFTVAFNTRHLANMPHGTCRYTDELSAFMFTTKDERRAALLMPCRVTDGWGG